MAKNSIRLMTSSSMVQRPLFESRPGCSGKIAELPASPKLRRIRDREGQPICRIAVPMSCRLAFSLALCFLLPSLASAEPERPRHLLLVSFDGAGDNRSEEHTSEI